MVVAIKLNDYFIQIIHGKVYFAVFQAPYILAVNIKQISQFLLGDLFLFPSKFYQYSDNFLRASDGIHGEATVTLTRLQAEKQGFSISQSY